MPPLRHVLITGGSRGLGLSTAQLFARNSYRCTLLSRSQPALQTALSTLESSHLPASSPHACVVGDVASPGFWSTDGAFGKQYASGKIDVLVNCAGITETSAFVRCSEERMREVLETNLWGMMSGTRYLLRKRLIAASPGVEGEEEFKPAIINIASLLGVKGGRGAVAYAASKAGVLGFTRALASEVGRNGIRVNAVVPGYVSTDMTAGKNDSNVEGRFRIPAGRFGRPEEIAEAVLFLAQNQYAMNSVVNIDGGLSAT
ncbi:NAD(P)-binding protein [Sporormia fimetaria CBS 119925]|uniref:NAD(P)-binding protein n=1 Tax=Sporormia fimetaria CBS 119925 TaxID=1340428 RepID=A0A6A6V521_9PLEO|nr:NAD(P)-binding protein [Sporormia fimetaria CBS 119925]